MQSVPRSHEDSLRPRGHTLPHTLPPRSGPRTPTEPRQPRAPTEGSTPEGERPVEVQACTPGDDGFAGSPVTVPVLQRGNSSGHPGVRVHDCHVGPIRTPQMDSRERAPHPLVCRKSHCLMGRNELGSGLGLRLGTPSSHPELRNLLEPAKCLLPMRHFREEGGFPEGRRTPDPQDIDHN